MKFRVNELKRRSAFTIPEFIAMGVFTFVMIMLFAPGLMFQGRSTKAPRIKCVNNLKNIGLAFRIYAADNDERFPGGKTTNELHAWALEPYSAYLHFKTLSNELSTPKIIICPSDVTQKKNKLTTFAQVRGNQDISYFVGLIPNDYHPTGILSGDRNLTNSYRVRNGFLKLSTNSVLGWDDAVHKAQGNIALGDGSVQQLSSKRLNDAYTDSGGMPDKLALPMSP
jgi:hypothetical protein